MKITICAVGRLRSGPERELFDDYRTRFDRIGRGLGLGPIAEVEVDARKASGIGPEAVLLSNAMPAGAFVVVLEERGRQIGSPEFAQRLVTWRDRGSRDLAFVIGGADGLSPDLRSAADYELSLGRMVWPHMLARVMLAEQLYRAASILAGTPYHRA